MPEGGPVLLIPAGCHLERAFVRGGGEGSDPGRWPDGRRHYLLDSPALQEAGRPLLTQWRRRYWLLL